MAKDPKSTGPEEITNEALDISGAGTLRTQTRGELLEANKEEVARMKVETYVETNWKEVIRKVDGPD